MKLSISYLYCISTFALLATTLAEKSRALKGSPGARIRRGLSTGKNSKSSKEASDGIDNERPKQGVFLLSNQPNNQVGVWESLDTGDLVWHDRYDTGGIGYPDPQDEDHLNDLGGSNAIHYHTWNDKQWLLVSNAGGPQGMPSITIFSVQPNLELIKTDQVDLDGTFACTVAGYGDRACVMTCAGNVTMQCFQISPEGTLSPEFMYPFQLDLPEPDGRPNRVSAIHGPANILFSPNGKQVAVLMKGTVFISDRTDEAAFWSFPIMDRSMAPSTAGFGTPSIFELPNEILPFAFTWRSGADSDAPIAIIVNIAGQSQDYPLCGVSETCVSSLISIKAGISTNGSVILEEVEEEDLNVVDGCWIEYRNGRVYTGNFISDSITVATVDSDGKVQLERTVPVGIDTIVNDLITTGPKIDGSIFLYTENQGIGAEQKLGEIGIHSLLDDGLVQVHPATPIPSGVGGWVGSNGLAATTISEEELFQMYGYK